MATYVLLATLTPRGAEDIKGIAERRHQNLEELAAAGITVVADYALLGEYDFLYIVEAPYNVTVMKQVIEDSSVGTMRFRTLPAFSMQEFVEMVQGT